MRPARTGLLLSTAALLVACGQGLPEPAETGGCSADALTGRAQDFVTLLAAGEFAALQTGFGLPENLAGYMTASAPEGLDADALLDAQDLAVQLLDGDYEGGRLVLFGPQATLGTLDTAALQNGKFSDFLVCHFTCGADGTWRLSARTCFEDTADPFHGDD